MEDVTNQSSIQEVASPETQPNQETTESQVTEQVSTTQNNEGSEWIRNLRKDRETYKREAEAQRLINEQLMKFVSNSQPPAQTAAPQEEDVLQELQNQEYVGGDKVAKALKQVEQKYERKLQEIETKFQQKHQAEQWNKLKGRYPDLEDVVNPDTLNQVFKKDPELAMSWKGLDDYTLALQAYPYIKHSGILGDDSGDRRSREVEKKLEENKKAPTTKVYETRPMAQAFSYKERQEANNKLYAEMMGYASITGGGY